MLYVDLDNFKAFNDVYGFSKGDEIIKINARIISKNILRKQCYRKPICRTYWWRRFHSNYKSGEI